MEIAHGLTVIHEPVEWLAFAASVLATLFAGAGLFRSLRRVRAKRDE